jgi:class 3 adenylate cyclase
VAKGRALLANALRANVDDDAADLELQAARDAFESLGARLDLEAVEKERLAVLERRRGPLQARKTFMFTDIVGSTRLAEQLGNEAWERLLSWHDDVLRGLIARRGGEVVHSTGDGFFVAFDGAVQAIACAQSIQQALAGHRQGSGFALSVRIGLHTAEASRRGGDYSGIGVHTAARVTALAVDGEILVTAETLADAGDVAAAGTREEALKGVTAPVRVAAVPWA